MDRGKILTIWVCEGCNKIMEEYANDTFTLDTTCGCHLNIMKDGDWTKGGVIIQMTKFIPEDKTEIKTKQTLLRKKAIHENNIC